MIATTLDRYLLKRALTPMAGVLISTMVVFLMERIMRSFQLLSQTTDGFKYLSELLVNLVPHYVGLTLPGGFFIGLFVVVNGLNKSSEIDAILASGKSTTVDLAQPVPVYIAYFTAESDGHEGYRILPDIYRWDPRLSAERAN